MAPSSTMSPPARTGSQTTSAGARGAASPSRARAPPPHGPPPHQLAPRTGVIANDFGWDEEIFLSFLPASHAYEHSGGQFFPIGLGRQIVYSEWLENRASNIEEVRPTIMVVVPRLFEVLRQRILKNVEKQGKLSQYLMRRALERGGEGAA